MEREEEEKKVGGRRWGFMGEAEVVGLVGVAGGDHDVCISKRDST